MTDAMDRIFGENNEVVGVGRKIPNGGKMSNKSATVVKYAEIVTSITLGANTNKVNISNIHRVYTKFGFTSAIARNNI